MNLMVLFWIISENTQRWWVLKPQPYSAWWLPWQQVGCWGSAPVLLGRYRHHAILEGKQCFSELFLQFLEIQEECAYTLSCLGLLDPLSGCREGSIPRSLPKLHIWCGSFSLYPKHSRFVSLSNFCIRCGQSLSSLPWDFKARWLEKPEGLS